MKQISNNIVPSFDNKNEELSSMPFSGYVFLLETKALVKSHEIVGKITNSADEMIKANKDKSESGRARRILNLNHGIITARKHNI
ncbi:MAG: hypothetical protein KAT06_02355 [Gammaproteobacteria bacterium]|nr:hypothetical protein [Gammaproteobacteria bacterium]